MEYVRPGDVLVVAELSRMTRSLNASGRNGTSARMQAGQPRLSAREHRYQHRYRTVLPVDDGSDPSDGTGIARRTGSRRTGLREGPREDRGRPRTDVVKLRDAKGALRQLRQDGGRGLQGRWRRQTHLLRLPGSTERSGFSSSHYQLDLFEGLGKNSPLEAIWNNPEDDVYDAV